MVALGCSHMGGVGTLAVVDDGVKINQVSYLRIFNNYYMPDMFEHFGGQGGVFQQDGASPHNASRVVEEIKESTKLLSPWPANSPDLNPLDYTVWGIMAQRVQQLKPSNKVELAVAIRKAHASLTKTEIQTAIDQFPRRINLVIQEKGKVFEYKM